MTLFSPDDLNQVFPEATPDALADPSLDTYQRYASSFVEAQESAGRVALTGGSEDAIGELINSKPDITNAEITKYLENLTSDKYGPMDNPDPLIIYSEAEGMNKVTNILGNRNIATTPYKKEVVKVLEETERTPITNALYDEALIQEVKTLDSNGKTKKPGEILDFLDNNHFRTLFGATEANNLYDSTLRRTLDVLINTDLNASNRIMLLVILQDYNPRYKATEKVLNDIYDRILVSEIEYKVSLTAKDTNKLNALLGFIEDYDCRTEEGKEKQDKYYDDALFDYAYSILKKDDKSSYHLIKRFINESEPRTQRGSDKLDILYDSVLLKQAKILREEFTKNFDEKVFTFIDKELPRTFNGRENLDELNDAVILDFINICNMQGNNKARISALDFIKKHPSRTTVGSTKIDDVFERLVDILANEIEKNDDSPTGLSESLDFYDNNKRILQTGEISNARNYDAILYQYINKKWPNKDKTEIYEALEYIDKCQPRSQLGMKDIDDIKKELEIKLNELNSKI